MSINPVVVVLFGLIIARLRLKLFPAFLMAALAFGLLSLLCFVFAQISLFGVIGIVALLSLGELMIVPLLSTIASEVAVKGKEGVTMGIIPVAGSITSILAGTFSKMVTTNAELSTMPSFGIGFGKIALIALVAGIVLQFFIRKKRIN